MHLLIESIANKHVDLRPAPTARPLPSVICVELAHDPLLLGTQVAMIQLGGGVGSIVPENFVEYLIFFLCIVCGSVLWAMVVGTICAVLSTGDPHLIQFKQNMDTLNYFLEDMNMPQELRMRAREYLRNTKEIGKRASYNELVGILSPTLRSDVVTEMSAKTLENVWYFAPLNKDTLVELSVKLGRAGYAPKEKMPTIKLNILMRGVAAKSGNILTPVATWGEDMIVTAWALRDKRSVSALSFVEVATLSRSDLDAVLESFPEAKRLIQQAAIKIAMQRAVVVVSEYIKTSRGLASVEGRPPADPETFDMIEDQCSILKSFASVPEGLQILQMLTGKEWRDVDEAEAVAPTTEYGGSPTDRRQSVRQSSSGADGPSTAAVMARLDAAARERATLTNDVHALKSQLDEITKLLKLKAEV